MYHMQNDAKKWMKFVTMEKMNVAKGSVFAVGKKGKLCVLVSIGKASIGNIKFYTKLSLMELAKALFSVHKFILSNQY